MKPDGRVYMAGNTYLPTNLRLKWVGNGIEKIRWEEHLGAIYVHSGNLGIISEPSGCQFKTRDSFGTI